MECKCDDSKRWGGSLCGLHDTTLTVCQPKTLTHMQEWSEHRGDCWRSICHSDLNFNSKTEASLAIGPLLQYVVTLYYLISSSFIHHPIHTPIHSQTRPSIYTSTRPSNHRSILPPTHLPARGGWGKRPMLTTKSFIYISIAWKVTTSALLHSHHILNIALGFNSAFF